MDSEQVRRAATELLRTDGRKWNAVSERMLEHVLNKLGDTDPIVELGLEPDVALAYASGLIGREALPADVRDRLSELASYDDPKAEPKLIVAVACVVQGDTTARGETDAAEFELTGVHEPGRTTIATRVGQAAFRLRVLQRYGPRCALCDVTALDLLEAAHLVPFSSGGTDDPRNGLVLCVNHHRALDRGLIRIDPASCSVLAPGPCDLDQLGIRYRDLSHLPARPHPEALRWRYADQGP